MSSVSDALGLEPGIDREQPREAAQDEARADQQDDRERDLDDDEQRMTRGAPRRSAVTRPGLTSAPTRVVDADRRTPRSAPNDERRHGGDRRALNASTRAVDADVAELRAAAPTRAPARRAPASPSARRAIAGGARRRARARGSRSSELRDQPRASGAERDAHRHLLAARRARARQQVGDVGARDQQHQADRREQQEQRALRVADQRVAQRSARSTRSPGCSRGILLLHLPRDRGRARRSRRPA